MIELIYKLNEQYIKNVIETYILNYNESIIFPKKILDVRLLFSNSELLMLTYFDVYLQIVLYILTIVLGILATYVGLRTTWEIYKHYKSYIKYIRGEINFAPVGISYEYMYDGFFIYLVTLILFIAWPIVAFCVILLFIWKGGVIIFQDKCKYLIKKIDYLIRSVIIRKNAGAALLSPDENLRDFAKKILEKNKK